MKRRHWGRIFARRVRLAEQLVPIEQRSWARAWLAEMEEIEEAHPALAWLFGGGRIVVRGWLAATTEEAMMKTVLATLSVINLLMGVGLVALFAFASDTPPVVVMLGIGLMVQSSYTLAFLAGRLDGFRPWSERALLVGQTIALLVGLFGFVSSALYNINPPNGDYEYGPLTVGALIVFQAGVALWVHAVPRERRVSSV